MQRLKKYLKYILLLVLLVAGFIFWANYKIISVTQPYIKSEIDSLPEFKTALILGTAKTLRHQVANEYFYNRIDAAMELYKKGKVKFFLVSGDNSVSIYNEPKDMKDELIERGVPDSLIYLDYAGFRTFDSVIRAKEIFGQTEFVVVSQAFHNQRAVYIARKFGIKAFGYNAEDVNANKGFKTNVREVFARAKVFIDLLTGKQPKFLGEKIEIGK